MRWLWRGLVVALVAGVTARVVSHLTDPASAGGQILPAVGGDTWPPVPVKDVRPA